MKEGWEYKKLEEACNIDYGTRVVQKKDKGSTYYVYGGGGATFMIDRYNRENCFIVSRFAMSPKCTRLVEGRFFLNDSGLSVSTNNVNLSQRFLDKVLLANNDIIYSMGKGLAQRNLDIPSFRKLQIPVPPLSEQEHIVSELDLLSSIIEKKKAQLKEYDHLAQSIFYDMFGDPVTNEKGWEVRKMGEVCTKITDGSHNPPIGVEHSDYLMLSSKNVTNQGFTFDEPRYLTKEQFEVEHKRTNVKKGDVLLVIVGAGVGKCCIYEKHFPVTFQRSVAVLSPYYRDLNSVYLNRFLSASHSVICNEAKGVAQKGIYLNQLLKVNIPLPPLPLQQSFASKIEAIERQKTLIQQSITEVETLFNSRMDYYFN